MKKYIVHTTITKEILDTIKVGDLIKINNWKKPMRVKGVSENYVVMTQKNFGKTWYSVLEKKHWQGIRRNEMRGGYFHCGTDHWIFGLPGIDYDFEDVEQINKYLKSFEEGKSELSVRTLIPILKLQIKSF